MPTQPSFAWFYCYCRPPKSWRSPARLWSLVWCSASKHSSQFPVQGCTERREIGMFSVGPTLSVFLSGQLAPHCSGRIPGTMLLYYTPRNTRGGVETGECEVKYWENPGTWQLSWTSVWLGLKMPSSFQQIRALHPISVIKVRYRNLSSCAQQKNRACWFRLCVK